MNQYTGRTYANNRLGTSTSGTESGEQHCPDGRVLTKLTGFVGDMVDKVCGECDDGTQLRCIGNVSKPNQYTWSPGPWRSISANYGEYLDNLGGAGGGGGNHRNGTACPDGLYFAGYTGRSGDIVDSMQFICGPKLSEFCVDNLEHPMCSDNVVNSDMLNAACSKNMSAKCIRRKNELSEATMREFCAYLPNEPLCACFKPVPETFPDELKGEPPHCWDQTCAVSGYKTPNMQNHTCRDITICKQDINLGGQSNILTGNVIVQDCSKKPAPTSNQPLPPNAGEAPINNTSNTPNKPSPTAEQIKIAYGINTQEPQQSLISMQTLLYLFIMIIFVSIIGYAIYAYDDNEDMPEVVIK